MQMLPHLPLCLQAWVYVCEELREVVVAFRGTEQVGHVLLLWVSQCLKGLLLVQIKQLYVQVS